MTEQSDINVADDRPAKGPTKAFTVQKLLKRARGATLTEMTEATGWLPHSTRAFMTGLRKKGLKIVRECRKDGETCWRIER